MEILRLLKDMNNDSQYIDLTFRKQAVVLYNGEFYFGFTHGGILSHILKGTDTKDKVIYRDTSIHFDRDQKKVAFGNLVTGNVLIFEDLQCFWSADKCAEEEEFYTISEIESLILIKRDKLMKNIQKAYTVLRDGDSKYSKYLLDTLSQIL